MSKITSFFAEGGMNVTWFGLLYPDSDTKNTGSSGEAHNIFDGPGTLPVARLGVRHRDRQGPL